MLGSRAGDDLAEEVRLEAVRGAGAGGSEVRNTIVLPSGMLAVIWRHEVA